MADRAEQIREAMEAALKARFGDGFQVSGYLLTSPTSPGFEIDLDPEGVNFDQAMGRGLDEWWFLIRGFVAKASDVGSQKLRDKMLNPSGDFSVKAAIEVDRTLGGACHACRVVKGAPRSYSVKTSAGDVTYSGVEFRVRVMATG